MNKILEKHHERDHFLFDKIHVACTTGNESFLWWPKTGSGVDLFTVRIGTERVARVGERVSPSCLPLNFKVLGGLDPGTDA